MYNDFGIIIIKPDGVKKRANILLENILNRKKINIVSRKKILISESLARSAFLYKFDSFVKYMCSGDIIVYLIHSNALDLDREVFIIKKEVRELFNTTGKEMENCIHGAHCGTEYFVQRKMLFPELSTTEYSSYADLYVNIKCADIRIAKKIKKLLKVSNVKKFDLNVDTLYLNQSYKILKKFELINDVSLSISETMTIGEYLCEIIIYLPSNFDFYQKINISDMIKDKNCFVALGRIKGLKIDKDESINDVNEYRTVYTVKLQKQIELILDYLQLKNIEVRGILCNTPNMELLIAESLFEICSQLNLIFIGGSLTLNNIGKFGISITKFKLFNDILNNLTGRIVNE